MYRSTKITVLQAHFAAGKEREQRGKGKEGDEKIKLDAKNHRNMLCGGFTRSQPEPMVERQVRRHG